MKFENEQKVLQSVIAEAWSNPSFKQALIEDPVATIESFTNETVSLPAGKTLAIYDQSNPDVICINIPVQPNLDNVELTDAELEVVAGGGVPLSRFPTIEAANTERPIIVLGPGPYNPEEEITF